MMQVFEMVVAIVAIVTIAGIIERQLKIKAKTASLSQDLESLVKRMEQQQERMEERLRVLEEIVSSDGYELKQRFKDLEE